jgi:hypothetical protein
MTAERRCSVLGFGGHYILDVALELSLSQAAAGVYKERSSKITQWLRFNPVEQTAQKSVRGIYEET